MRILEAAQTLVNGIITELTRKETIIGLIICITLVLIVEGFTWLVKVIKKRGGKRDVNI